MNDAGAPEPRFETFGDSFKVALFPIGLPDGGGVNGGVNDLLVFIQPVEA
jgi:hypothetical protein